MTHDEKIVEAVARAIAVARGMNPDANQVVSVPVIVSGRLTDTGHDTRVTEKRDRVSPPAWQSCERAARAAITAFQAEAWQPRATLPRDATISVVVAATDKNRTFAGRRDVLSVYIDSEGQFENDPENEFWEIVLWQPLPPAPKATPDRSEQ